MNENTKRLCIVFLDSFTALVIVFVATCFYWRGSWDTIEAYVLPNDEPLNHWIRFAIGACTCLTYFSLPFIKPVLDRGSKPAYLIGSRIFMLTHGTLYMFQWRGLWGVADYYIGPKPEWGWLGLVICYGLLIAMGNSRQLIWPPYMTPNDDRPDLLIAANRFGIIPERRFKYFLDCLFTSVGINGLAMITWRSAWAIMDAYIYPDDSIKSDMFCVIFGLAGVVFFFLIQLRLAGVSKWLDTNYPNKKIYRIIYEDIVYMFVYVTLVLVWRGCWHMNERYVFSDPKVGGPVNLCIGLVALMLLRTYSIIAACGCIWDGGEALGGAFFPVQYLYIYTNPNLFARETYAVKEVNGVTPISKSAVEGQINHGYGSNEPVVVTVAQTVQGIKVA